MKINMNTLLQFDLKLPKQDGKVQALVYNIFILKYKFKYNFNIKNIIPV